MYRFLKSIVDRIKNNGEIQKDEAKRLLDITRDDLLYLFQAGDCVRRFFKGDRIFACSIINAKSGICSEDCSFCSQSSRHKAFIKRYPLLSLEELVEGAKFAYDKSDCVGFVTSGGSSDENEFNRLLKAIKTVKREGKKICASLGFLTPAHAEALKQAGLTRYNHNLETTPAHFRNICTTHSFEKRVETISVLKNAGIEVCSGGIWGLGESALERIEFAFILKEIAADSVPLNILNPIPGTKIFGKVSLLRPLEILKTIAIYRLILPHAELKICGGREVSLRSLQPLMFLAGANGFITGNYLTTQGQASERDMEMINDLELEWKSDSTIA